MILFYAALHNDDITSHVLHLDNIKQKQCTSELIIFTVVKLAEPQLFKEIINIAFKMNQCLISCRAWSDCNDIHQYLKKLDKRAFCSGRDTRAGVS